MADEPRYAEIVRGVLRYRWGKEILHALAVAPMRHSRLQEALGALNTGAVHQKSVLSAVRFLSRHSLIIVRRGRPRVTTYALLPAGREVLSRLVGMTDNGGEPDPALREEQRMTLGDQHPSHQIDTAVPSAARVYDYLLGGDHNYQADRDFATQVQELMPLVPEVAKMNRRFLRRVVTYLLGQGVRQFLDLGSGIPTVGNVHQIAQEQSIEARVVYVDYEPVAYLQARTWLADVPNATMIEADIRDPDSILRHREIELLDFTQPLGLLMVGILLFIGDEDRPAELVHTYRRLLTPGSFLAISHIADEHAPDAQRAQLARLVAAYEQAGEHVHVRGKEEIASWFDGMILVEPGVVHLPDWRPEMPGESSSVHRLGYGAVALQP